MVGEESDEALDATRRGCSGHCRDLSVLGGTIRVR